MDGSELRPFCDGRHSAAANARLRHSRRSLGFSHVRRSSILEPRSRGAPFLQTALLRTVVLIRPSASIPRKGPARRPLGGAVAPDTRRSSSGATKATLPYG